MQLCSFAATHKDLLEISALKSPPQIIADVMGYIGILLGLKPTWEAVHRSLLKELIPLQRFLKEVDPRKIPIRRIAKASALFHENIYPVAFSDSTMLKSVSVPISKVFRYQSIPLYVLLPFRYFF